MEKEDFAKSSGFSRRTEWLARGAMTLTKGLQGDGEQSGTEPREREKMQRSFPGLGPLASNPMSRNTTTFCLLAITPSTMMTKTKTRTRTRTRMMSIVWEDCYTRLVDLGIYESCLRLSICAECTEPVTSGFL
ncbi:hypothetical protein DBV15_08930 [Temnothorax longispinosus]|uniref:Uncharacterized protein n=1 Tax=Temnothorax longispinosus TaxID=300112 RepID=A0A4V3S697_9HYME|nr:hypothetical protein DBV15_08930 [Temnothorax longispinosus]